MARAHDMDDFDDSLMMVKPRIYLIRMLLFLAIVSLVTVLLFEPLESAFYGNGAINSVILGTLFFGSLYVIFRVTQLFPEVTWVNAFRRAEPGLQVPPKTSLLAPMAALLRDRSGPVLLTETSTRTILDSIASRMEESRDISRYVANILIILGLLGTFWGLLQTTGSFGQTIDDLSMGGASPEAAFEDLKSGLAGPLAGMATAFSSSLFGLAGSLIIGFLDLQAAQAQNKFYNDFEEWLSTVTQLSTTDPDHPSPEPAPAGDTGGGSGPAHGMSELIQAMEANNRSLEMLRDAVETAEDNRSKTDHLISQATKQLLGMSEIIKGQREVLNRLSTIQKEGSVTSERWGRESVDLLKGLDETAQKLLESNESGREQLIKDLRAEMKLMTKTTAALLVESQKGDGRTAGKRGDK